MALALAGFEPSPVLFSLLLASLLLLWRRPSPTLLAGAALALAFGGGWLAGSAGVAARWTDCRLHLPHGWEGPVEGRPITRVEAGRAIPFRPEEGLPGGCARTVRLLAPDDALVAGRRVRARVRWEARDHPDPAWAEWAGRLRILSTPEPASGGDLVGKVLSFRGALQERMAVLWGPRAPMVEALVLARREHLDPDLRDAFGLSGTAHLLAISGFHVGVVAGLILGLLRVLGVGPRGASAGAAAGCWLYVLGIGAPHAAVRAALLLTLLAVARMRGRPVVSVGALSSALLLLLVVQPLNLASVGFQLSFAGTGGLVLLRRPLGRTVDRAVRRWRGRPLLSGAKSRGAGEDLLRGGAGGIVAGTAATLPTLPLLAWHFDRVSVVGVPATLAMAPLVTAVIPGIALSLVLDALADIGGPGELLGGPVARFIAGAVAVLLVSVQGLAVAASELPGASVWVSRMTLAASLGVGITVASGLRWWMAGRIRPGFRSLVGGGAGCAVAVLLPVVPVPGTGALELHVIDVGQGDALALRTPAGRWLAVDAGPRSARWDAGARRVIPYLRRHGVRRLEALVLSHPHLDHVGGAPAILQEIPVRGILDPSRPEPLMPWLELLRGGRARGVSWWKARAGATMRLDGVELRVLYPDARAAEDPEVRDLNQISVVLQARYGHGVVLLTGDAGSEVEQTLRPRLSRVSVLKVGHHGSRTSTGEELLGRTRPRVAAIPVGDGNRYGHPHEVVTGRLRAHGISLFRTDRDGDLRLRVRGDGTVSVRTSR